MVEVAAAAAVEIQVNTTVSTTAGTATIMEGVRKRIRGHLITIRITRRIRTTIMFKIIEQGTKALRMQVK